MLFSPLFRLSPFAVLLSLAFADPNSVCLSYGVDFTDEGHYFINQLSSESFTCVSTFKGCNQGVADVLLVNPSDEEYLCSQIPTTPEDTPELSTCPILKSQMTSGDWIILVLGNNGDGNPFAWERGTSLPLQFCMVILTFVSRYLARCRSTSYYNDNSYIDIHSYINADNYFDYYIHPDECLDNWSLHDCYCPILYSKAYQYSYAQGGDHYDHKDHYPSEGHLD